MKHKTYPAERLQHPQDIYQQAVQESQPLQLRARQVQHRLEYYSTLQEDRIRRRIASTIGAIARREWALANKYRLIRVFA